MCKVLSCERSQCNAGSCPREWRACSSWCVQVVGRRVEAQLVRRSGGALGGRRTGQHASEGMMGRFPTLIRDAIYDALKA